MNKLIWCWLTSIRYSFCYLAFYSQLMYGVSVFLPVLFLGKLLQLLSKIGETIGQSEVHNHQTSKNALLDYIVHILLCCKDPLMATTRILLSNEWAPWTTTSSCLAP